MIQEATLYRELKKGYVQCLACEHFCAVEPGGMGKCGIRRNYDGKLHLVVYGEAAALHVDPVEKKPLYHFLPTRPILSLGTLGCNFQCQFCQNWEISQAGALVDPYRPTGRRALPEDLVNLCRQRGIPMLAYTYNEPAVFFEYAYDTAKVAHEHGIRNVFVSSGFETLEALNEIEPYLDAINVDLKSFRDQFYREVCSTRLAPVLRNIEHIARHTNIWIEITTLVIPGLNDSDEELAEMAGWLAGVSPDLPWHLSAFHPDYMMLDRPPTPHSTLMRAWEIGKEAGLHYVYVGNVRDSQRESTCCPTCGTLLISRSWYNVTTHWNGAPAAIRRLRSQRDRNGTLDAAGEPGTCPGCGQQIPGVWR